MTPFEDRFQMVELACEGRSIFEPSQLEEGEGTSYSIDTIDRLKPALEPGDKLFFLIGSDAFDEIESWHRWQDLVREVEFIVVSQARGRVSHPGWSLRTQTGRPGASSIKYRYSRQAGTRRAYSGAAGGGSHVHRQPRSLRSLLA